jgi:hypothetical protein
MPHPSLSQREIARAAFRAQFIGTPSAEPTPPASPDSATAESAHPPDFPRAILSYSRAELQDLRLTVKVKTVQADGTVAYEVGQLPPDLQGHVFIASPVGDVDSTRIPGADPNVVLPSADGWTNLLNGDGMIYRIDFHQPPNATGEAGGVWLSTKLVKPPSFYADQLTYRPSSGAPSTEPSTTPETDAAESAETPWNLSFFNLGIARLSLLLGMGSQVNTGLQWIRFPQDGGDRLIVTNDASRPYEVDPCTLKTLAPVGLNQYWEPLLDMIFTPAFAFPGVMSAAHPAVDPLQSEFLTVNVQRSAKTTLRVPTARTKDGEKVFWRGLWELIVDGVIQLVEFALNVLDAIGLGGHNKVYLARWQGGAELQKWLLKLPNGKRVKIKQSSHMLGITRNHVVIVDTAFKLAPKDMLPGVLLRPLQRWLHKLEGDGYPSDAASTAEALVDEELEWLVGRLTYPQSPDTQVYIVSREQLQQVPPGQAVTAQPVTVEGEFAHFLTDYEETPDGRILLHAAMTYATDPAEFINRVDDSIYGDPEIEQNLRLMAGMWADATDVNSPAVLAIDPTGQRPVQKYELDVQTALDYTLFLGLYAYSDGQPTQHFEDIYWAAGAADPKLFTEEIYRLYESYKYRRVSIADIKQRLRTPMPMYVLRMHLDRPALLDALSGKPVSQPILQVADRYTMPPGYIANSPQFIPKNGVAGSKAGYLLCVVIHSDQFLSAPAQPPTPDAASWSAKTELWIFDAENLAQGPLYTLSHANLNMGLSLHTTWAKSIVSLPPRDYSVSDDYAALVDKASAAQTPQVAAQIRQLFAEVYQRFNAAR